MNAVTTTLGVAQLCLVSIPNPIPGIQFTLEDKVLMNVTLGSQLRKLKGRYNIPLSN